MHASIHCHMQQKPSHPSERKGETELGNLQLHRMGHGSGTTDEARAAGSWTTACRHLSQSNEIKREVLELHRAGWRDLRETGIAGSCMEHVRRTQPFLSMLVDVADQFHELQLDHG